MKKIKFKIILMLFVVSWMSSVNMANAFDFDKFFGDWFDDDEIIEEVMDDDGSAIINTTNENTKVETNIKVNANTGGNVITNGNDESIKTGDAVVDVYVENIVDGEESEPIDIEITAGPGEYKKVEIHNNDVNIEVSANASDNEQKIGEFENLEIDRQELGDFITDDVSSTKDIINKTFEEVENEILEDEKEITKDQPEEEAPEVKFVKKIINNISKLFKKLFSIF